MQMTSRGEVAENLAVVDRLVRRGAADGCELVVLPECFAYLGREEGKLPITEPLPQGGPILAECQALAKELGVELILGGFWERGSDPGHAKNACVQVRSDGSVGAVYRKIHLFDVDLPNGTQLRESETVEAGTEPIVADAVVGKLGLSVCYDLRFPELYRALVDQGARVLAVPAAFTLSTGKDHWHVLLRARAIEAQCFVLAAAQTGHHYGKRISYGHALICDPWGTVLAECGDGEGIAVATIDLDVVDRVRGSLPSLRHRRL